MSDDIERAVARVLSHGGRMVVGSGDVVVEGGGPVLVGSIGRVRGEQRAAVELSGWTVSADGRGWRQWRVPPDAATDVAADIRATLVALAGDEEPPGGNRVVVEDPPAPRRRPLFPIVAIVLGGFAAGAMLGSRFRSVREEDPTGLAVDLYVLLGVGLAVAITLGGAAVIAALARRAPVARRLGVLLVAFLVGGAGVGFTATPGGAVVPPATGAPGEPGAGALASARPSPSGTAGAGPRRILPHEITASASASLAREDPRQALDLDVKTIWNSGAYATQWIELDLGGVSEVRSLRLVVAQSPGGDTVHEIFVAGEDRQLRLVHAFREGTRDQQNLRFTPTEPLRDVRYVRITTSASPSWVAWAEVSIEAYGVR